ncbi:MAG: hypothetical protein IKS03_06535 [Ruminococcus sp.]|nr:hypothetical protein [Ruminococcus sp.]
MGVVIPAVKEQADLVQKMKGEICQSKYKAVSFRLMDTLVMTPFSEFGDMFGFMEKDFAEYSKKSFTELRISAQDEAEKKYNSCVSLDNIYEIFAKNNHLSDDVRDSLKNRECELFEYFAFTRSCGAEFFRTARDRKKKIILVYDSIYPENTIKKVLAKCGYSAYNRLITLYSEGIAFDDAEKTFDKIIEKSGVSPDKILHIGGNVANDIETPILKGSKALLLTPVIPLMVKSGRLRGYVQAKHVYNYDSIDYLMLHCVFGLYACYNFDIPINKTFQSDFCSSLFKIGFIILGSLSLVPNYKAKDSLSENIKSALENCPECVNGRDSFRELFEMHFHDLCGDFSADKCSIPFEYFVKYSAAADRQLLSEYLSEDVLSKWEKISSQPDTAPVYGRKLKKNAAAKLADTLFPQGTKVRNIADGMLIKIKSRGADIIKRKK